MNEYMSQTKLPTEPTAEAHRRAMAAKTCIFSAQDALSLAWSELAEGRSTAKLAPLLRKLERRLARVRTELDQLDNDYRRALRRNHDDRIER